VNTACFSHDGRRALTASDDRTAKVWLLEPSGAPAGKELLTLRQHDDAVTSAAFSPDDRTVVTTSRDGAAILWRSVAW
jgi:WD40 repeat protein